MKKLFLFLFISVSYTLLSKESFANSTFYGDQGLINTPSAYVLEDRKIELSISGLSPQVSYILNKQNVLYSTSLGFIPRTEVGIIFNHVFTGYQDPDNAYLTTTSFDRSIMARFQVLYESEYIPALVIGGRDIFSNAIINRLTRAPDRQDETTAWQQIFYLVAGKKFYDFTLNVGYSYAPGVPLGFSQVRSPVNTRINGLFGGIETPKLFSIVSAMLEFDTTKINYGINIGPFYGLEAKAVMIDLTNFNFKASWSAKL